MKAVILAGGYGTRISEESGVRPKPMVEIGGKPIIWHIMKIYSHYGINDFVICCGYKGYVIKEFFSNYFLHQSDVTFDLENNTMEVIKKNAEPWKITLIDTGEKTMTGGRIKRVREHIRKETFCLTYGDGVSDVPIDKLIEFHKKSGTLVTLTAVQPPGRFGAFVIESGDTMIKQFQEKQKGDGQNNAWINGGFFVVEPKALDYIQDDSTVWEMGPLQQMAASNNLNAFIHTGYWQSMDTLRDKNVLEEIWNSGNVPWKKW